MIDQLKWIIITTAFIISACGSLGEHDASYDADVIIIGSTPGGIAAALAAARDGKTVLLVSHNYHVGGMMASGLGKSDIENRAMIQGVFKEFINLIYEYYVKKYGKDHENVKKCRNGYYYEPSVAEAVFEQMLAAQSNITLMKGNDHEILSFGIFVNLLLQYR